MLMLMGCFAIANAQGSSMSDAQVIEYARTAASQGKDAKAIAQELLLKGVTREQLMRLKERYESQGNQTTKADAQEQSVTYATEVATPAENADPQKRIDADEFVAIDNQTKTKSLRSVWGRGVFTSKTLTFEPSTTLPTPKNYVLGPGDEVVIDIFGVNQTTERQTISKEGTIHLDVFGPVHISGMKIEQANAFLKDKLSGLYAGLGDDGNSDIILTLGRVRTIQIIMMGEVATPGTYHLSSLSTAFHALYRAGGVGGNGSLRDIRVMRGGRLISTIDVYHFLMNGDMSSDIVLQDGDVIMVAPIKNLVRVNGTVKRSMMFELKDGESLSRVLDYAGGFAQGAYKDDITVLRENGRTMLVKTVPNKDFSSFVMKDGDEVTVGKMTSRYENRLEIKGSVYLEGVYELGSKVHNITTLIEAAGGLMPEAYTNRALLHRERLDKTLEVVSVDLKGIIEGRTKDIELRTNDQLYIPSIYDMQDFGYLTISGEVANPGQFPFADNTTVEDLIVQAGGLLKSASVTRVEVERRIMDQTGTVAKKEVTELFSFGIKDGFVVDGQPGFVLKPYDNVIVRKAPSYAAQRFISISGEVNFPGRYAMSTRDMRLTDLVDRAGGMTDYAYIKGARLKRNFTAGELSRLRELIRNVGHDSKDSIGGNLNKIGSSYYVAIDLEKALADKGGSFDLVLREGDELELPVYNNTVSINGGVQYANTVTWIEGKKRDYYINEAGGFLRDARKNHAFVISMNGHVQRLKAGTKIEPGSEIIVPIKKRRSTQWFQVATTTASMATMLATIYNIIKK